MAAKYKNPFAATFNGILDLFRKGEPIGELKDSDRLDGKTCLLTGANSGLGFAVATQLAQRGARVLMACRSGIPEKGEEVKQLSGSDNIEMLKVDLTRFDSIHGLVDELKSRGEQIDIGIFNAAMVPGGSRQTPEGFDEMFMVNYLAKFVLVNGLLDAGLFNTNGSTPRIIFVSSESHRTNVPIDFDQLGIYEEYSMGKVVALYGYYKLAMNTLAAELQRRLNADGFKYSVHALCPGPVNSNIAREAPSIFKPLLKVVFGIFFSSPTKAAEPVMYLAASPDVEGESHVYLHLMQQKEMDEKALDPENGKRIWARSEELTASFV